MHIDAEVQDLIFQKPNVRSQTEIKKVGPVVRKNKTPTSGTATGIISSSKKSKQR